MHRSIRDDLEEVLRGSRDGVARHLQEHLDHCQECSSEVRLMREQATLLRDLRSECEPRAGFYARVMERIEAEGPASIWSVFSESPFARRLAVVSMALALFVGGYVVAEEQKEHATVSAEGAGLVWNQAEAPDRDTVLVNLVTYQEQ